MFLVSRTRRFVLLITAFAVLNGAAASAWQMPAAPEARGHGHCRTMRSMQSGMQHCEQTAMMACCRDSQEQPRSTLPQAAASSTMVGCDVSQPVWLPAQTGVSLLHTGSAWYARPPTHGYWSQSLRLLQSVILI